MRSFVSVCFEMIVNSLHSECVIHLKDHHCIILLPNITFIWKVSCKQNR